MTVRRPGRAIALAALTLAYVLGLLAVVFYVQRSTQEQVDAAGRARPQIGVTAPSSRIPARLRLPKRPRVLVVGDSYTEGWGAEPMAKGFGYRLADLLDWQVTLDGAPSTGYLAHGRGRGTFRDRLATTKSTDYDLIVLQGGTADADQPSDALIPAVESTVAEIGRRFGSAQVLLMGPVSPYGNTDRDRSRLNAVLARYAREQSVPYLNPLFEKWFTPRDQKLYVDPAKGAPNNRGHERIARLFAEDVARLSAPAEEPAVLIFGDSYTEGYGAADERQGWAYRVGEPLRWRVTVDGIGSTGYVNAGGDDQGNYRTRLARRPLAAYDVVVLQGSSNDQRVAPDRLAKAVRSTVAAVRVRYPGARVVMLGPVALLGNPTAGLIQVDEVLSTYARHQQIPYIDPIAQGWFAPGESAAYANPANGHPNEAGYARIAERFIRDIESRPGLAGNRR